MRAIRIITFFLVCFTISTQAQDKVNSSDQTRTIEINNENGDLLIKFKNNVITKFIVNDQPIPEDRYADYQEIIDDFSEDVAEPVYPAVPVPPTPPSLSVENEDKVGDLITLITDHLSSQGVIDLEKKIKVELKTKYLKVGKKKLDKENHTACLDFFERVYGHRLNDKSVVKFKKSKRNSSSSIRILE